MLTRKQIDQTIRGAFLPFRCAVEFRDHDAKVRFMVFDHSRNGIAEVPQLPVARAQNEASLRLVLNQVRRFVQNKGYTLNGAVFS